jgi:hypothetical protein
VTRNIEENISRIITGLNCKSGQRAWRITGGYGSGKSSFALLLAHLYARNEPELPSRIRRVLKETISQIKHARVRFLPVLVTGLREPLAVALVRALAQALEDSPLPITRRVKSSLAKQMRTLHKKSSQVSDQQVLNAVLEVQGELIEKGVATGLLIILDELGKFLEFSALHPERQDVYFLQQLAEVATHSNGREPLCL